jgi:hypothetical protein
MCVCVYIYIYIYITLRYVSVKGSSVSGLQLRNRTYKHKICRATCYTIPSIVGGVLQSVLNLIQCVKVLRGVKMAEPFQRTLRNHRRNANES